MGRDKKVIYRGAEIQVSHFGRGYLWTHLDYVDCDFVGGNLYCTGCGYADSIESAKEDIDQFLNEIE